MGATSLGSGAGAGDGRDQPSLEAVKIVFEWRTGFAVIPTSSAKQRPLGASTNASMARPRRAAVVCPCWLWCFGITRHVAWWRTEEVR